MAMNRPYWLVVSVLIFLTLLVTPKIVAAGSEEIAKVEAATAVLREMTSIPENGVPPYLLTSAQGIAILPDQIKAGFILGARYGTGILVVRLPNGGWSNPAFVTLMGGSLGWQIGAQSTDIILIFKTTRSVDAISSGKFTLGADASVAAGPVGRHAEAATDVQLQAEILSYSRSRGLFAGLALEGASLQIDYKATSAFYNVAGLLPAQIFSGADIQSPYVVNELKQILAQHASP